MRVGARLVIAAAIAIGSTNAWAVPGDSGDAESGPTAGTPVPAASPVPSAPPEVAPATPGAVAPVTAGTGANVTPATTVESGAAPECVPCEIDALKKTVGDLRGIIDAGRRKPFGEVANAIARRMDVEHDLKIKERGCGKYIGTKAYRGADVPRDVQVTDCTTYVVDVLRETFAQQGKSREFEKVMARALRGSPNGLKGTELIKALMEESDWKALFWAPDPLSTDPEHRYAAHVARTQGTYYKIKVEKKKAVVGYNPADPAKADTRNLEKLKRLPFGVLAARGGSHMSLVLQGKVYEVHWADGCESMRLIEDTDLEKWAWKSGVIAAPRDELENAWRDS